MVRALVVHLALPRLRFNHLDVALGRSPIWEELEAPALFISRGRQRWAKERGWARESRRLGLGRAAG
jgi:hypothetical protein